MSKVFTPVLGAAALVGAVLAVVPAAGAATPSCDGLAATIVVPSNTATANGTEDADVIYVEGVDTVVYGLGGDDVICTSDGSAASLLGGEGSDRITGRGEIDGGPGDDVLVSTTNGAIGVRGGEGNDQIVMKGIPARDIWPGPGDDTIDSTAVRGHNLNHVTFAGTTDGVTIRYTAGRAGTIDGEGHDTFRGRLGFYGTKGHDTFYGSSGDDTFTGFGGDDEIWGYGGDDTLGAVRPALIDGGAGDDTLAPAFGGVARGGSGHDVFDTRSDGSTVDGGPPFSAYHLDGGRGRDVFHLHSYTDDGGLVSNPTVDEMWRGTVAGGPDADTLDLAPVRYPVVADLRAGQARWGAGSATLAGIDSLIGSSGNDVLRGNATSNRLVGRRGNDLLIGRDGRDTADGGPGRDTCRQVERRRGCERR